MRATPSASKKWSVAGVYAALTAVSLIMLVPFLWMLSTSFKRPQDIFTYPPQLIPPVFQFQNYVDVFTLIPFHRFYFNSVYISFVVVAGTVFSLRWPVMRLPRFPSPEEMPYFWCCSVR